MPHAPRPLAASFPPPSDYPEYDELQQLMAEDRRRQALDAAGLSRTVPSIQVCADDRLTEDLNDLHRQLLQNLVQSTTGSHKRRRALAKHHRLWCRKVARWATSNHTETTRKPLIKKGLTR